MAINKAINKSREVVNNSTLLIGDSEHLDMFFDELVEHGILEEEEEMDYLTAKKSLNQSIRSITFIAKRFRGNIIFENNYIKVDDLVTNVKEKLELSVKNSALKIEEIKKKVDGKEEIDYVLVEGTTGGKNSEYERMVHFLNMKTKLIEELKNFEKQFNSLFTIERKILYYSFFKKETDMKISMQRVEYCVSTLYLIRKQATIRLVKLLLESSSEDHD